MNAWLRYLLRYPLEVKAPLVQPGNVPLARQSFGEAYATVPLPDDDSQFTSADKSTAYDHFVYGGLAAMAALGIGITAYALTAPTTLHDLTDITVGEYLRASFAEQAAFLDRMAPIAQALLPPQSTENCVICLSNPATIKTNPCGHVVMCQGCDLEDFHSKIGTLISARHIPSNTVMDDQFFLSVVRTCSVCRAPFRHTDRSM